MIPDPRWCDAHPVRCARAVSDHAEVVRSFGLIVAGGFVVALATVAAADAVRRGRYRQGCAWILTALTVAALLTL
jgi:hypothetical protein